MKLQEINSHQELEFAYPVIKELRPHLSFEDFIALFEQAMARDEYRLIGLLQDNQYVAVMGYRILFDFVHGKHLYIDDLVVISFLRSKGLGKILLDFGESEAKRLGCKTLRLCTGTDNHRGKQFYEKNCWSPRAVVYKKKVASKHAALG